MAAEQPRMYSELADWFHLITAPEEYVEEANFYFNTILEASDEPPHALLELGSGGGNNAFHYKRHVVPTLTDLSPDMLRISQRINPECEHIVGDMRGLRLGREFDAVFAHDAIGYLITEDDLRQAMQTAFAHLRPGGVALFAPDSLRETFAEGTETGGNDAADRSVRWLEWTFDPDPTDNVYTAEFAYLLHRRGEPTRTVYDRHENGLFGRSDWLRLLNETGFVDAHNIPFNHSELPPGTLEVFVAKKPG